MRCYITLLTCGRLLLSPPEHWGAESLLWFRSTHLATWLGYGEDSSMPTLDKLYNLKAPYSKWDVRKAYGSAEDCAAKLSSAQKSTLDYGLGLAKSAAEAKDSKTRKALQRSSESALLVSSLHQRFVCIPSDSVKLD